MKKNIGKALLVLAMLAVAAAIATLIPDSAAKPNDLGYRSLCTFAPWSTLILLIVAGLVWVIRQYILTRV